MGGFFFFFEWVLGLLYMSIIRTMITRLTPILTLTAGDFFFFLHYQNKTTNVLINYYEVFLLGFCCYFVKVQSLLLP